MFGIYRTLLALLVVSGHLAGTRGTGAYAVFGFYVLSGYLMTLIMHQNYGFALTGVKKFFLNRFLRIFPLYWLSVIFSLGLILVLGEKFTSAYHENIHLPHGLEWLMNALIFFPMERMSRLTPPAWTLTVELFFYVCIGLGLSRNKKVVKWWFIASVAYHIVINLLHLDWHFQYALVTAASLPFSTGAMIYHYRTELSHVYARVTKRFISFTPLVLFCLIIANWYISTIIHMNSGPTGGRLDFFFYINFVLNALMAVALKEPGSLPLVSRRLDSWVGDFSYPIFLTHLQVGMVMAAFLGWYGIELQRPQPVLFLAAIPLLFLSSWLLTIAIEKPIDSVRERIKKLKERQAQPASSPAAAELAE